MIESNNKVSKYIEKALQALEQARNPDIVEELTELAGKYRERQH